ncbi:hypothetical protein K3552_13895 [Leisingera aquaemixtae]|uniref:hypothetical protein n=1 Tax=Leisingera aquaemixtae TaxID=1396826 RepID=UPI0021A4F124|nr:hypothetical protein [Leisingera aquaemixtae]UWQ39360.1 hypothetical protein K3552_13895 [Leisingera aquaemixtae]
MKEEGAIADWQSAQSFSEVFEDPGASAFFRSASLSFAALLFTVLFISLFSPLFIG